VSWRFRQPKLRKRATQTRAPIALNWVPLLSFSIVLIFTSALCSCSFTYHSVLLTMTRISGDDPLWQTFLSRPFETERETHPSDDHDRFPRLHKLRTLCERIFLKSSFRYASIRWAAACPTTCRGCASRLLFDSRSSAAIASPNPTTPFFKTCPAISPSLEAI
jgi:hypothetical protein